MMNNIRKFSFWDDMQVAIVPRSPKVEIDKFGGNPLEYQYFVSMFN